MLTPKQVEEAKKQLGINTVNPTALTASNLVQRLESKKQSKSSVVEKIANFTGGKVIAQGLGQALAQDEISKNLNETQKSQMELADKFVERIREKKALGEDTTKLEESLKELGGDINKTASQAESLFNPNKITTKQVVGDALQLGTTVIGAGQIPSATKTVAKATTFGKGLLEGAKTGALTGATYGASTGVSDALKKDGSTKDVVLGGIKGGVTGAVAGGLVGGVIGGVSGGARSVKKSLTTVKPEKEKDFVLKLVSPKATEKVKQEAIAQGRVSEQGLLRPSKILPSNRDIKLADSVKGVVSSKKSTIQNVDALDAAVSKINNNVKSYVKKNKVPFNANQLKAQLNKGKKELRVVFASDKQAEKTYDAVVREFMKHVKSKDTAGLLEARQAFDKIPAIRKLLESQGLGENVKKEIVLTARQKGNEYIASLLPKGNKYRADLLKESHMLEVLGNIADKNTKEIGLNKLQSLAIKYPVLKWAVSGAVGAGGIGVGSAIIGSLD